MPIPADQNDIFYILAEKLTQISSAETLLDVLADIPYIQGISTALLYGPDPDSSLESPLLHLIAHKVFSGSVFGFEHSLFFGPSAPVFVENAVESKNSLGDFFWKTSIELGICSSVLLPLKVNTRWVGLIYLGWDTPQQFFEATQRFLISLGHQLSWVLYGVELYKDIQIRIQSAEVLLQANTALLQAGNEHEIVDAIASLIRHHNADRILLSYLDTDPTGTTSQLTIMARWTRYSTLALPKQQRIGRSRSLPSFLDSYLLMNAPQKALLFPALHEITQGIDSGQLERTGFEAHSLALIPLHRGVWTGFVSIGWHDPHVFSKTETLFYDSLIQLLSPVISSRQNYLAIERERLQSEQRAKELETVSKVSAAASRNLEVAQLLQTVVDLSTTSFNLYNAHLYLLDATERFLILAATSGEAGRALKALGNTKLSLAHDPSIAARCARTRQGVIINDVTKDLEFIPNPLIPEVRSEMAVPMVVGDIFMGVLNLQSKVTNRFTPNVLLVMQALADEIAVAVQNARLFEEQFKVAQELRNLDKLKNQFLANMSHELRTPLNAILNFTYFVSSSLFGPVNDRQKETLNKVTNSGRHLLSLINDILDFSKIEAGMMQLFWEDVELDSVLDGVIDTANALPRHDGVELIVAVPSPLPTIRADKQRIRQILLNLISNALKFTEKGMVTISARCDDQEILFLISDTGTGIAPDDQVIILEAFKQTERGVRQGGTGLGLPISKYLTEAHGGKLWLTSEPGIGSTFFVSFPTSTHASD